MRLAPVWLQFLFLWLANALGENRINRQETSPLSISIATNQSSYVLSVDGVPWLVSGPTRLSGALISPLQSVMRDGNDVLGPFSETQQDFSCSKEVGCLLRLPRCHTLCTCSRRVPIPCAARARGLLFDHHPGLHRGGLASAYFRSETCSRSQRHSNIGQHN
jgi:hypothetical protein